MKGFGWPSSYHCHQEEQASLRTIPAVCLRAGRSRRFEVFSADAGGGSQEPHIGFTKRMAALVCAEEAAVAASEPAMADRLARVLMGGCDHVK